MEDKKFTLTILQETFGICHLDEISPVPEWALENSIFRSITRTSEELSIVCVQKEIPGGVLFEKDWRTFKLESVNDLHSVGVIASLSKPLADAGISIFNVSTYQTNYIMVEEKNLNKAIEILSSFCEIKK